MNCEFCGGKGCIECSDEIWYRAEELREETRRDSAPMLVSYVAQGASEQALSANSHLSDESAKTKLLEKLKQTQINLGQTESDYDALVVVANVLAVLANDPILANDPESAQMLREIAIDSVGRIRRKR